MPLIETKDLLGDPLDLRVAEDFHRICNAPFVLGWMDDWNMSLEEAKGLIKYFKQGYEIRDPEKVPYILGIWHKETMSFIGICGFGPKAELNGEAEIAYFMDEAYSNRGYMTQFVQQAIGFYFNLTGKPYLSALVDERNLPSKRLLEKMGFVRYEPNDPTAQVKPHYRIYYNQTT